MNWLIVSAVARTVASIVNPFAVVVLVCVT